MSNRSLQIRHLSLVCFTMHVAFQLTIVCRKHDSPLWLIPLALLRFRCHRQSCTWSPATSHKNANIKNYIKMRSNKSRIHKTTLLTRLRRNYVDYHRIRGEIAGTGKYRWRLWRHSSVSPTSIKSPPATIVAVPVVLPWDWPGWEIVQYFKIGASCTQKTKLFILRSEKYTNAAQKEHRSILSTSPPSTPLVPSFGALPFLQRPTIWLGR